VAISAIKPTPVNKDEIATVPITSGPRNDNGETPLALSQSKCETSRLEKGRWRGIFKMNLYGKAWKITKNLLICGIASTVLYISTDILAAMTSPGYSYLNQAVSELSAIGAPTRPLWLAMSFLFNPLLIAFGIGVRRAAGEKRSLRITGILLAVWGVVGFLWLPFPMHLRGAERSFTDTMHIVMTGVTVLLMTAFIGFGAAARGKWFRIYSVLTIVLMYGFGALTGMLATRIDTGPTPWMGAFERIIVYAPMLWVLVLAVVLLRGRGTIQTEPARA